MRPRLGNSGLPDDPRVRPSDGIDKSEIAAPLSLDAQGRATVLTEGAIAKTPAGRLEVRVDHGLEVVTGSPEHIAVRTSDSIVVGRDKLLHAVVRAKDVRGLEEFVKHIVFREAKDISYAEPLVSATLESGEAPLLYSADGTDIVVSEVVR